jgi:plasmid stabilization system protein ParE
LAQVVYAAHARSDLDRLYEFLAVSDPAGAAAAVLLIDDALAVLARHPLIGRLAEEGKRELVISRARSGHVALYESVAEEHVVLVLALRHQREAGYAEEP